MSERTLPVALQDLRNREIRLPVCPVVFVQLLETLGRPDAAIRDLRKLLSSDAHLATQVLRVANSAMYGHARQVRSIDDAILRIGFTEVWAVASAVKAKELFQSHNGEWSQLSAFLWEHALTTATIAKCIANRVEAADANLVLTDVELVFTAALLHDLGKSVLHQFEPQYGALCQNGALHGSQLMRVEQDFFGTHHGRFGAELLRHWNLPDALAALVDGHHDQPSANDELLRTRLILALANQTAHAIFPAPYEQAVGAANVDDELLARLGLEVEAYADVVDDARQDLSALKKY